MKPFSCQIETEKQNETTAIPTPSIFTTEPTTATESASTTDISKTSSSTTSEISSTSIPSNLTTESPSTSVTVTTSTSVTVTAVPPLPQPFWKVFLKVSTLCLFCHIETSVLLKIRKKIFPARVVSS